MRGDSASDTAQLGTRNLLLEHQKIKISAGSSHRMSLLFRLNGTRPREGSDHSLKANISASRNLTPSLNPSLENLSTPITCSA
jgi:hypothetical protein